MSSYPLKGAESSAHSSPSVSAENLLPQKHMQYISQLRSPIGLLSPPNSYHSSSSESKSVGPHSLHSVDEQSQCSQADPRDTPSFDTILETDPQELEEL